MIEALLGPLQRAALHVGTLVLVGAATWRWLILPRISAPPAEELTGPSPLPAAAARVARIARYCALGLLPVWALRLYVQVLGFRDPFVPLREDLDLLIRQTTWGTVWLVQGALLLFLLALLSLVLRSRRGPGHAGAGMLPPGGAKAGWAVYLVATVFLALTLALSSHAMAVETGRVLAVSADLLHTLAAGAWIGTLALILSTWGGPGRPSLLAAQFRAFSPLAMVAVAVLLTMGTYLSVRYLTSVSDLWATAYGRVLAGKIGVAGLVLLMGALNWRKGIPNIDSAETVREVRRRASIEVGLVLVVLLLTGVLTGTAKP